MTFCPQLKRRLYLLLASRRLPLMLAVLAMGLTLPSLGSGLLMDDYHCKLLMDGSDSPVRLLESPLDMFCFFDGDPQRNNQLRDLGLWPWWTYEGIKGKFWRPLSSGTHWFDYTLWPQHPALMHAHSIIWYGALALVVGLLYQRLIPVAWIAGLAGVLYAVDDAHGVPVSFLANRNALLACFFGVLTILAHDRWRRDNWHWGRSLGPLCLGASLLSAEAGISTCAYLGAYALCIERDQWTKRIKGLLPYICVVLLWRTTWTVLDYGVAHMGIYIDPLTQPWQYLSALKERIPLLLLGQWSVFPPEISMALTPRPLVWIMRGAWLFLILMTCALVPLLRRDRWARFWALGMLFSILPICATFPHNRLLLFVGIGAMGLLAQFLGMAFGKSGAQPAPSRFRMPAFCLAGLLIFAHLVIAPLGLAFWSKHSMMPQRVARRIKIDQALHPSIEDQDLVVVNPPIAFAFLETLLKWAALNQPVPRHTRVLTSSLLQPVEIRRPNTNTLVVRPTFGHFVWTLDRLFCSADHPLGLGDRVELSGMSVEITGVAPNNVVTEASFVFDRPLQDATLHWLKWQDGQFIPFEPPEIGRTIELQAFSQPGTAWWELFR